MRCLDEGTLQAYLDSELTEAQMQHAADHLGACAACGGQLARLQDTAARVSALLDLLPAPDAMAQLPSTRTAVRRRWAAAGLAAAAIAASIALFVAGHRPTLKTPPLAKKETAPVLAPAVAVPVRTARVAQPKRARPPILKQPPAMDDFVLLGDADPMQLGMVIRVMVPISDAQEIAADLVVGEDGRARAIRFVE